MGRSANGDGRLGALRISRLPVQGYLALETPTAHRRGLGRRARGRAAGPVRVWHDGRRRSRFRGGRRSGSAPTARDRRSRRYGWLYWSTEWHIREEVGVLLRPGEVDADVLPRRSRRRR
ncbi:putative basic proline-rich protein-like [Iris pallida]|uniref:Basic proline-rich protein-like n=1 Tax=Iris pallida TaxID=29817 RepID=A0AAX6HIE5_IRIPA|nr:putative basic proline-rich protein-like [Iris pallida]